MFIPNLIVFSLASFLEIKLLIHFIVEQLSFDASYYYIIVTPVFCIVN